MRDALGAMESVLVLGGGSDIALATVKELAKERTRTVILAGKAASSYAAAKVAVDKLILGLPELATIA